MYTNLWWSPREGREGWEGGITEEHEETFGMRDISLFCFGLGLGLGFLRQ
jgi:hypothetical protein